MKHHPSQPPNDLSRDEFIRAVSAVMDADVAQEMVSIFDSGWRVFQLGDPISLALAAVSSYVANVIVAARPDLRGLVEEYRADPEAAFEKIRGLTSG